MLKYELHNIEYVNDLLALTLNYLSFKIKVGFILNYCMQITFALARALIRQAKRATIGYLVYNLKYSLLQLPGALFEKIRL